MKTLEKKKMWMRIFWSECNLRSHILCAVATLSYSIRSERKSKCRKSILTTYLKEDFFKNNLINLQTKHSP